MDVSISRDHGVMGGKGKLCTGTKEGDGAVSATIEDRLVVKCVGTLSLRDQGSLEARLRLWLQL